MNKIEQIKAEIERRRRDIEQQSRIRNWGKSYYVAMSELLDIIANLPEEQPSEDLANAAWEYASKECEYDAFTAGAGWQKAQMMKDAIEGEIVQSTAGYLRVTSKEVKGYKFGEDVKVIIVKEGE